MNCLFQETVFVPKSVVIGRRLPNQQKRWAYRTINLRIGVVLSPKGDALKQMLPDFRFGLGGRIGSGDPFMNWIAIDDLIDMIYFSILNSKLTVPVNAIAPYSVSNFKFKQTPGKTILRFSYLSIPIFALKMVLGEMVEKTILSNLRVNPQKLLLWGYKFRYLKH